MTEDTYEKLSAAAKAGGGELDAAFRPAYGPALRGRGAEDDSSFVGIAEWIAAWPSVWDWYKHNASPDAMDRLYAESKELMMREREAARLLISEWMLAGAKGGERLKWLERLALALEGKRETVAANAIRQQLFTETVAAHGADSEAALMARAYAVAGSVKDAPAAAAEELSELISRTTRVLGENARLSRQLRKLRAEALHRCDRFEEAWAEFDALASEPRGERVGPSLELTVRTTLDGGRDEHESAVFMRAGVRGLESTYSELMDFADFLRGEGNRPR